MNKCRVISLSSLLQRGYRITKHKKLHIAIVLCILVTLYLVLSFHRGKLPPEADLTVVHLTDLHLSTLREERETPWTHKIILGRYKLHQTCLGGRTFELLEEAIRVINESIKPDVVVITGDIVNEGDDVEALRKGYLILKKIQSPLVIAKGDHDLAQNDENKSLFESLFGQLEGTTKVNGHSFLYLSYHPDNQTLQRVEERIKTDSTNKTSFLCMHRMLQASVMMRILSKKYCPTLLSPKREKIVNMLENSKTPFIVLCGHSHTNYEKIINNVTHFSTASLAEYPHELRVIKIKEDKIYTRVFSLSELRNYALSETLLGKGGP